MAEPPGPNHPLESLKIQELPDDPFSYLYLREDPGIAIDPDSQKWIPPELMMKIATDAIIGGRQACVFSQFLPQWNICGGDPASPRQLHHCHTYIKSTDIGEPGELHLEHHHQCIRANVLDPTMDSTCFLNTRASGGVRANTVSEQVSFRRAFAPYQRWVIPSVVRRSTMAYGLLPQLQYAVHTVRGDIMGKGAPVGGARPIALDPAAKKQLPFKPTKVPTWFQGCADERLTRHFHEDISILTITVDKGGSEAAGWGHEQESASLREAIGPEYAEYLNPDITNILIDQVVKTDRRFPFNICWEKFNRRRPTLRAVFLDLQHLKDLAAAGDAELVRLSTDMLMAGLQLDVICLAGTQHALALGLRDLEDYDIREMETKKFFELYVAPDEMLIDEGLLVGGQDGGQGVPLGALSDEEDVEENDGEDLEEVSSDEVSGDDMGESGGSDMEESNEEVSDGSDTDMVDEDGAPDTGLSVAEDGESDIDMSGDDEPDESDTMESDEEESDGSGMDTFGDDGESDTDMADDDGESGDDGPGEEEAGDPEPKGDPAPFSQYVNPIALFRPILKPGGRLILIDPVSEELWNSSNMSEPQFPPISLVLSE